MSSGDLNLSGDRAAPCAPVAANSDAIHWDWPTDVERFPEDAPLQALLLTATKLMGAYAQDSVRASGLKLSIAGLGVLRILMGEDGLKASEVATAASTALPP